MGMPQTELAAFLLGPPDTELRLAVTTGQGPSSGNVLMNVNRWRMQLSLPPVATLDQAAEVIPLADASAYLVDLSGTPSRGLPGLQPDPATGAWPTARILAALVVRPAATPAALPGVLPGAGALPAAGALPGAGGVWFFKITGPDASVAAHRAEFRQFIASIRLPPSP
jgi:hypothetical protein